MRVVIVRQALGFHPWVNHMVVMSEVITYEVDENFNAEVIDRQVKERVLQ